MREIRVGWDGDGDGDGVGQEMRADERDERDESLVREMGASKRTELEMMRESTVRQNKRMKKKIQYLYYFNWRLE